MKTTASKQPNPRVPAELKGLIDPRGRLTLRGYAALDRGIDTALDVLECDEEDNDAFTLVVVWNKTRKKNDQGKLAVTDRPESEWIRTSVKSLRIIDEDLWKRVQSRRDETEKEGCSHRERVSVGTTAEERSDQPPRWNRHVWRVRWASSLSLRRGGAVWRRPLDSSPIHQRTLRPRSCTA